MDKRRIVFLDRDGVINKKMPEGDYVKDWDEFEFLPGVLESLKVLKENNFLVVVVTNQRCVGRGIITEDKLSEIHRKMISIVRDYGADIDAVYFCPHDISDSCVCRKPKPGMITDAIRDFKKMGIDVDTFKSFLIGDDEKDILAGNAVGLKTIKIGVYLPRADITKESLSMAIKEICSP